MRLCLRRSRRLRLHQELQRKTRVLLRECQRPSRMGGIEV
jgi:hypothetical protein